MPYPSEHAARQLDPEQFERFVRIHPKGYPDGIDAIIGYREDGTTGLQSLRFDKKKWTPAEAKKWLKDHDLKADLEEAGEVKKGFWEGVI